MAATALSTTGNDRIVDGGNLDAFTAHEINLQGIREEAGEWLTGETIKSAEEAERVELILDMTRKASKAADDARTAEKEPHLKAGRKVDAKWKPLITSASTMADVCKQVLAPWRIAEKARKEAEAARIRAEAEAERQAEAEATRAASGNIDAREEADQLAVSASAAEKLAKAAEKSAGKGNGLRTVYRTVMTDGAKAAEHYWRARNPEFKIFLSDLASDDVRAGSRSIPGFDVIEEKKAV